MDRTVLDLSGPKITIPPRPACPPWCAPDACQLAYDALDGWAGLHAAPLDMVTSADAWWTVQLQQFATGADSTRTGISLDAASATPGDWMTPDQADQLAAALLSAAARLRAASRFSVVRAA